MTTNKKVKTPAKKVPIKNASIPAKNLAKSVAKPSVKDRQRSVAKKPKNDPKVKVLRDSFTMPKIEYQKIAEIKAICLKSGIHVKKSEILRAGLKVLAELNTAQLKRALNALEKIKTGRPKLR